MNVAIIGAGAMGAYFATRFHSTPGFTTRFIISGQRLEKLNQDGIVVNGKQYSIPAIDPAEAKAPAGLIIVAVKHHQLAGAVAGHSSLVGDSTVFLSVMNGLEAGFPGAEQPSARDGG